MQSLIGSQNLVNVAYTLYLTLREQDVDDGDIEKIVRRWYVMSILTGRYSGAAESDIDYDIKQVHSQGAEGYLDTTNKRRPF